ncbi:hypothetical protein [Bradyrhizobium cenepequi]
MLILELDAKPKPPAKPKRPRKPADYSKLFLRNGRLTRAFWLLKEGFVQDVRNDWVPGKKHNDWRTARYVDALVAKGWLEQTKGPRKGIVFRTTREGAFMMMVAECQPRKP